MQKPLRVILYEPLGRGGICHYTYQLAEALAALNLHVIVSTPESYELKGLHRKFDLYYHPKKSILGCFFRQRFFCKRKTNICIESLVKAIFENSKKLDRDFILIRIIIAIRRWYNRIKLLCFFIWKRPNIIHFQWLTHPKEDIAFIKILKLFGFYIIYTAHNILPHDDFSYKTKNTFNKVYHSVNHIIVHAEINKYELTKNFCINQNKVNVIYHGSYNFFKQNIKPNNVNINYNLDLLIDKKIILFFGHIRKYKGLEYLIDSFDDLSKQINDARLLIVGKIKMDIGDYDRECNSKLYEKISANKNIIFINKYVNVGDVDYFLSMADVVVLPYIKIYQSGVLMLAMASGKPVVVTNVGGLGEIVESEKIGYVVPPRDSSSLTDALVKILDRPDYRQAMGEQAKLLANTKYSWENIGLKTKKLYQSIKYN